MNERTLMPAFMVERTFADQLEAAPGVGASISRVDGEAGVRWLKSFMSAKMLKKFCVYKTDDIDSIRTAAGRAGLPDGVIVGLSGSVAPMPPFVP